MANKLSSVSSAALLLCSGLAASAAHAQTATNSPAVLAPVKVQSSAQQPDVGGFGDVPAREVPLSVTVIDAQTLADVGAKRVSDAARLDASVADSYNSPAYWDILSIRGFTLDNRYNYRRDGLPISAETMIPLDNIERIEILKGTSGIQAGTSSPGGLVNYVVKRPPATGDKAVRSVSVTLGSASNAEVAFDLGGRFGQQSEWGYRINAAAEHLDPYTKNSNGQRRSISAAMDWRISRDTLLEWEFAHSTRQQYGVNGYSLLGNALPAPVDPRVNLTTQPWSVPGLFVANTGSVRLQQALANGWTWKTQYGAQRLRTDDRLAFAFGCTDGATYYNDRFCPNGNYDAWDFRSDNEKRLSDALLTELAGQQRWGAYTHDLQLGLMRQRQLDRMSAQQAYNYVGTGSIYGSGSLPASPTPASSNTNRSEYATEWSLKDRIRWNSHTSVWLGLRQTRFARSSVQNTAGNFVQYDGSINTPWLAVSSRVGELEAYASHGHGVEFFVVPNNGISFANAGQQLGAGRSRQTELGLRSPAAKGWSWHGALFQIERPLAYDIYNSATFQSTRHRDGIQTHRGIELGTQWQQTGYKIGADAQVLHARISGTTVDPSLNGTKPLNVPEFTLRAYLEQRIAAVPGLRSVFRVSHEGPRNVTENGSVQLPSWTTLDAALHWDTRSGQAQTTWTLEIDNLTNKRYWRESPKMFGHYYLYAGAPRTWRASMKYDF